MKNAKTVITSENLSEFVFNINFDVQQETTFEPSKFENSPTHTVNMTYNLDDVPVEEALVHMLKALKIDGNAWMKKRHSNPDDFASFLEDNGHTFNIDYYELNKPVQMTELQKAKRATSRMSEAEKLELLKQIQADLDA